MFLLKIEDFKYMLFLSIYHCVLIYIKNFKIHVFHLQVNNNNVSWREFLCHWPLWSIYIAHFSMNWSNYIIMQWLPTYMTRTLGAEKSHIMFTAVPYIMNSLVGMGKNAIFTNVIFFFKNWVFRMQQEYILIFCYSISCSIKMLKNDTLI